MKTIGERSLCGVVLLALTASFHPLPAQQSGGKTASATTGRRAAITAFPSAEGFGARAVGGRGGRVIEVTNLNDSGPGSLRAAMEASGPRIVVFRVSGTITLTNAIRVRTPYYESWPPFQIHELTSP